MAPHLPSGYVPYANLPPLTETDRLAQLQETVSIGDFGGQFQKFHKAMVATGMTGPRLGWRGGARTIVFHGDILVDRGLEGFKILQLIHTLREQISKLGGDVIVLAGNHDYVGISLLTGRITPSSAVDYAKRRFSKDYPPQGLGLLEFTQFTGDGAMVSELDKALATGRLDRTEILRNMQGDALGKIVLDEICRMRLCHTNSNVLRIHTDPTDLILTNLNKLGADDINKRYQTAVGESIMDGQPYNTADDRLFHTFLNTRNRTMYEHLVDFDPLYIRYQTLRELRQQGTDCIIYAHSNVAGNNYNNLMIEDQGVKFVSVDLPYSSDLPSAAITSPSGIQTALDIYNMGGIKGTRTA